VAIEWRRPGSSSQNTVLSLATRTPVGIKGVTAREVESDDSTLDSCIHLVVVEDPVVVQRFVGANRNGGGTPHENDTHSNGCSQKSHSSHDCVGSDIGDWTIGLHYQTLLYLYGHRAVLSGGAGMESLRSRSRPVMDPWQGFDIGMLSISLRMMSDLPLLTQDRHHNRIPIQVAHFL